MLISSISHDDSEKIIGGVAIANIGEHKQLLITHGR